VKGVGDPEHALPTGAVGYVAAVHVVTLAGTVTAQLLDGVPGVFVNKAKRFKLAICLKS